MRNYSSSCLRRKRRGLCPGRELGTNAVDKHATPVAYGDDRGFFLCIAVGVERGFSGGPAEIARSGQRVLECGTISTLSSGACVGDQLDGIVAQRGKTHGHCAVACL